MIDRSPHEAIVYTQREIRTGWALHAFTASGVIIGMLGLQSIVEGHARAAILWLVVAMLMDGIDGPIARKINVRDAIPHIDGNALDLIVDYFTCTIVPVAFLDKFNMLPDNTIGATGFVILLTGALWMARTDMETPDRWFRGFPAEWNVIVPTLYLLSNDKWLNLSICGVLCVLSLVHVEFPHPVSVREKRPMSLACMGVWIGAMCTLAIEQDRQNRYLRTLLVLAPMWTLWMVIDRAYHNRVKARLTSGAASAPQ
jgi:phosphatidylcholine synthase